MITVISAAPIFRSDLVAQRYGQSVVADPARALCESYGYQTLYETPTKQQTDLRLRLVKDHVATVTAGGSGVYDHAIFPWLADWMRWHWGATTSELWEAVIAAAAPAAVAYGKIIHITEGPRRSYDGYAWLDACNGAQVDRLIRHLYRDFGVEDKVEYISA